jgi:hypothetical protein
MTYLTVKKSYYYWLRKHEEAKTVTDSEFAKKRVVIFRTRLQRYEFMLLNPITAEDLI